MRYFLAILLFTSVMPMMGQTVVLDSVGRPADYVQSIIGRSQKIVDGLGVDAVKGIEVRNILCNRYFWLNDLYEKYPKDCAERNAELYKHHFEFEANLSNYLDADGVEMVKDGMTYGVVPKTYKAHLEMIPTLKEEEKLQILNWLKEAREFAIDAQDSKSKHGWFGKYKGRINNWLAGRGYDLVKEREGWYERIRQAGGKP